MPRGHYAKTVGKRLWVLTGDDEAWASDVLEPQTFSVANQYRVTDGTPDNTVTMAVFNETSLVVLKQRSVWRFTGLFGTLSDLELFPVTKRYGCVARNSVMDIGTDLWWWSQDGPASLVITQFNELQPADGAQKPQPGNDILPLIQRVNGMYKSGICGAVWDRKVYFAVPLDDADATRFDWINGASAVNSSFVLGLEASKTYRYQKTSTETSCTIGTTVLSTSNDSASGSGGGTIAAASASQSITSTLREVFKGVNNAVLVYDLAIPDPTTGQSGVWQGYDQREGVEPKFFYLTEYLGQDRLAFAGSDGWTCLYEENFDGDAHPTPFVDVVVSTAPPNASAILKVAGGTELNGIASANNGASSWGVITLLAARSSIWVDSVNRGGYYHAAAGYWTSPNTAPVRITNGVRFYSLDGQMPAVVTDGGWDTLTRVFWQEITSTFTSRSYSSPQRMDRKRGIALSLSLETYRPQYDVFTVDDSVNEVIQTVADRTYSRTAYTKPFNKAAWTPTNASDDFDNPYRGDYSVICSNSTQLRSGFGVGLQQAQIPHCFRIHSRGRGTQLRIVNKTGRIRVLAMGYEGLLTNHSVGLQN